KKIALERNATFRVVDNAVMDGTYEAQSLLECNILLITGGNTFELLNNLKRSGLDKAILKLAKKDEFVIAGFSAGAFVMTPSIAICNLEPFDDNLVGLQYLEALSLVPFEV